MNVSANPILEVFVKLFWTKAWQGRKPEDNFRNFIQVERSVPVFLATVKLKLNKGFFNQRLILVLKNIISMWSDGVLFAFNQAEVPNVRGQQIDFNYATSQQQIYMKGN